jgi:hypothetical protein
MTQEEINALAAQVYAACHEGPGCPSPVATGIPRWSAWWETNMKETVDNYGIDRQVPFWHYSDKVANNQSLLEMAGSNGQADQRRFATAQDTQRAADDNLKSLLQAAAVTGLQRHVDDNHVLTTNVLAALVERLGWISAMEINITAAQSMQSSIANKIADIAQKALDVQSGGVIGNALKDFIPQPLVVSMK